MHQAVPHRFSRYDSRIRLHYNYTPPAAKKNSRTAKLWNSSGWQENLFLALGYSISGNFWKNVSSVVSLSWSIFNCKVKIERIFFKHKAKWSQMEKIWCMFYFRPDAVNIYWTFNLISSNYYLMCVLFPIIII